MANSKSRINKSKQLLKLVSSDLAVYKQNKDEKLFYSITTAVGIHLPKIPKENIQINGATEEQKLDVVLRYIYKELFNYSTTTDREHLTNAEQAAVEGVKAFPRIANSQINNDLLVGNLTSKYHAGGLTKSNA